MSRADSPPPLAERLSPPVDPVLAAQLVEEFAELERRYVLRDWGPSELSGGKFAEVLARILYHLDGGNLDRGREFGLCRKFLSNTEDPNLHRLPDMTGEKRVLGHLVPPLEFLHRFRSERGVAHVSDTYTANGMDARLVLEAARWLFSETLRLFWTGDREAVAAAVRETLRFDVPCIGSFGGARLVQRPGLDPEREVLLLLYDAGESGASRSDLVRDALCPGSTVDTILARLCSPDVRAAVKVGRGLYRLGDIGVRRVREDLADLLV